MNKITLCIIGALVLGGCTGSMSERMQEKPTFIYTVDASVDDVANCLEYQWGSNVPLTIVDTKNGKRFFNGDQESVGHVVNVISEDGKTKVVAYIVSAQWAIEPRELTKRLRECQDPSNLDF